MWMLQIRGELDLLEKAVRSQHRRQLCVQNLDGNFTVMLDVLGEIHRGHTARAKLALDAVMVSERCPQTFVDLRHFTRALFAGLRQFCTSARPGSERGSIAKRCRGALQTPSPSRS